MSLVYSGGHVFAWVSGGDYFSFPTESQINRLFGANGVVLGKGKKATSEVAYITWEVNCSNFPRYVRNL